MCVRVRVCVYVECVCVCWCVCSVCVRAFVCVSYKLITFYGLIFADRLIDQDALISFFWLCIKRYLLSARSPSALPTVTPTTVPKIGTVNAKAGPTEQK